MLMPRKFDAAKEMSNSPSLDAKSRSASCQHHAEPKNDRPQFGLRLMLLVVALIAAIVAYLAAVYRLEHIQNVNEQIKLERWLAGWERADKALVDRVRKMTTEPQDDFEADVYHGLRRMEEIKRGYDPEYKYKPWSEPRAKPD